MRRLIGVQSLLLIAAISFAGSLGTITSANFSASSAPVESGATSNGKAGDAVTSKDNQKSLWEIIRDLVQRGRSKRGSRSDDFCSISPDGSSANIWNVRPIFIWQGTVKQIEVRPHGSSSALWVQNVIQTAQSVPYTGPVLQSDQEYDYWVRYETMDQGKAIPDEKTLPFKVMGGEERRRIEAELAALENQRRTTRNTDEAFALARVNYFAEKGFWSDAFQALFSVQNPSPAWTSERQKLLAEFCK